MSYSTEIFDRVKAFFDKSKLNYSENLEDGTLRLNFNGLDCRLRTTEILVRVRATDFFMLFFFPLKADEENIAEVSELLMRANYMLPIGRFIMDYRDGEISLKMSLVCEDTLPTDAQVKRLFDSALYIYERFGNTFLKVYYKNATPEEGAEEFAQA